MSQLNIGLSVYLMCAYVVRGADLRALARRRVADIALKGGA